MTLFRSVRAAAAIATVVLVAPLLADKPLFTDAYSPAEFAAHRAAVMNRIGDGVAIVTGATERPDYEKFKQNKQFFYLCGVEVPRAIILIDGRAKASTLFLPPHSSLENSEGPLLGPDDEARKITGVEKVVERSTFDAVVKTLAADGRTIYVPFRQESIGAVATDRVRSFERESQQDPWDGRSSKSWCSGTRSRRLRPGRKSWISIRSWTACASSRVRLRSRSFAKRRGSRASGFSRG